MENTKTSHINKAEKIAFGASAPSSVATVSTDGRTYPRLDIHLLLLRQAEATNQGDKVYALLGISSGYSKDYLKPNYNLSLSETYMRTAKVLSLFVPDLPRLAFLSVVQHPSHVFNSDIPTWIPDWRNKLHAPWLIYNSGFRTTDRENSHVSFLSSSVPPELVVRALPLMKIAWLGLDTISESVPSHEFLDQTPHPFVRTHE